MNYCNCVCNLAVESGLLARLLDRIRKQTHLACILQLSCMHTERNSLNVIRKQSTNACLHCVQVQLVLEQRLRRYKDGKSSGTTKIRASKSDFGFCYIV